ncbi:hypothetical protein LZ30DRAFT_473070 [Colletotrichum cereale]|nr:hypothetical protein LZ30DRAFT_473070 [Colletotrichum cereale]
MWGGQHQCSQTPNAKRLCVKLGGSRQVADETRAGRSCGESTKGAGSGRIGDALNASRRGGRPSLQQVAGDGRGCVAWRRSQRGKNGRLLQEALG